MRLLGKCPECGAEDSIAAHEDPKDPKSWSRVTCSECGKGWDHWFQLTSRSGIENPLIPVEIEVSRWSARVELPDVREIPCARTIAMVLNTALKVRFRGLDLCFAVEGGLEGVVGGRAVGLRNVHHEPIELRNICEKIGLGDEHHHEENPVCQRLLNWYGEILCLLFEEELVVGGRSLGRGAILKLSPEDPLLEEKAKSLLYLALWKKTGSEGFAKAVFERLEEDLGNPISAPYIAGLSDEQIAAFFVPPPLQEVPTS